MMKRFHSIFKHEVLSFVRAPLMYILMILCPIVVVGFIPRTLGNINKVRCAIVDMDRSSSSREITQIISSAKDCLPPAWCSSVEEAMGLMEHNSIAMIIVIPEGYERDLELGSPQKMTFLVDGARVLEADLSASQMISLLSGDDVSKGIISHHRLYNDEDHAEEFYLVSLISMSLMLVAIFLIGLSVIGEKKNNTLSQIIVTGVDMRLYLGVKVLFYSLVVIIELFLCLAVGYIVYDMTIASSLGQLILVTYIFTFPLLFIGVFIASIARNDVQAIHMMIFLIIFLVMLSSMIAPLANMSGISHYFCRINPAYWLTKGIRAVIIYGFPLRTMLPEFVAGILLSVIFFFSSIRLLKRIS
ncbi:MAG TPA: ABC transporter permease [Bacteroidales bacterium]|jgi:ABC-2 type transport system permease protein|nr:ABC transporter permease [Bacteroidales bacterium]HPB89375.1 ABC transporter permease [Bacteroidales bacterium]HPH52516.1 ABC transporter permease [Bacteroidales bacterium]HPY21957.1 ABC transporter permease [Bacteroidales bacterium]HQA92734.1 ABC transporter permease [Bacteroidales bacterium]